MALRLHNTLTRRTEEFVTREPGKAAIYVCGPTVYDSSHLGHMRAAVIFDILRRYLESRGMGVTHVQNITDVDDRIIQRSQAEGTTTDVVSGRFIEEYRRACRALRVLAPDVDRKSVV